MRQRLGARLHAALFTVVAVIEAEEMEEAMREQERHLAFEREPVSSRLRARRVA